MSPLLLAAALLAPADDGAVDVAEPVAPLAAWDFGPGDDRDFDRWPDGWLRRRGPGFPHFVPVQIDPDAGDGGALWLAANGGAAAAYSPPVPLPPGRAVRLTGRVAADRLDGHAAVLSLSLLDETGRRLARFLTDPVAGTAARTVALGPVPPTAGAAAAVVGVHLVPGAGRGVRGEAWVDDLVLTPQPHLSLVLDPPGPVAAVGEAVTARVVLGGVPRNRRPEAVTLAVAGPDGGDAVVRPVPLAWADDGGTGSLAVPLPSAGLWAVTASAAHGGGTLDRTATVAAAEPGDTPDAGADGPSRFGWTLSAAPASDAGAVADAAAAGGAGWVRWPAGGTGDEAFALASRSRGLRPVLMLTGETFGGRLGEALADVLAARPDAADAVAALAGPAAAHVRHWQLGADAEPPPLAPSPGPSPAGLVRSAAPGVVTAGPPSTGADVTVAAGDAPAPADAWRVVPAGPDPDAFAWSLLTAAAAGAGPVFAGDAVDPVVGLLTAEGRPTRRFLPFRTVSAAVGRGRFLGRVRFPAGLDGRRPAALAFETPRGPVLALRGVGDGSTTLRLDGRPVGRRADGRPVPLPADAAGRHRLAWSPAPLLVAGSDGDLLRFRLGVTLGGGGLLRSSPAPQPLAVRMENPFAGPVTVSVSPALPAGWRVTPETAAVRLGPGRGGEATFTVRLPSHVSLGEHEATLSLRLIGGPGGELTVPRPVRVRLEGMRLDVTDRRLPGGGWEVTQTLAHALPAGQEPAFRCDLLVPGAPRVSRATGPLAAGSHTLVHRLPDAAAAGETVWLRVAEVGGARVLNRKWPLGSPPPPGR